MPRYEVTIKYDNSEYMSTIGIFEVEVDDPKKLDDMINRMIYDNIHLDGYVEVKFDLFGEEFEDEIYIDPNILKESIMEFISYKVRRID